MSFFFQSIPIVVVFKAMGFQSDQLIVQIVGTEPEILKKLGPSIEECYTVDVNTQNQALK